MTQKQLNKILTILERRRDEARDHWLTAIEYHLDSVEWWQGQFIGLDLIIQEIYNNIAEDTDNN